MKGDNIFRTGSGFRPHCAYVVLAPLFFLVFCLLYNPFGIKEFYVFGNFTPSLHILMLTCIICLTLAAFRVALMLMLRRRSLKWWQYVCWCGGEVLAASTFMALYTSLFGGMLYGDAVKICAKYAFLVLWIPYLLLMMLSLIKDRESELDGAAVSETPARFYDEHKRLKLTVDKSALLCIKAEYNYIKIYYLDSDKIVEFMLRNSMKSQEAKSAEHGLVRCHRSYFVNPKHVKVLSKDTEGQITALLDSSEPMQVPVSKQYYDQLADML